MVSPKNTALKVLLVEEEKRSLINLEETVLLKGILRDPKVKRHILAHTKLILLIGPFLFLFS